MPPLNTSDNVSDRYVPPSQEPLKHFSAKRSRTLAVSFSEQRQVRFILHRNDYTCDEKKNTWYFLSDNSRFRKEIAFTIKLITSRPEYVDGLEYTSRGVEGRVKHVSEHRHHLKQQAWSVVLDGQEAQRQFGGTSEDVIASDYIFTCKHTVLEAIQIASRDQLAAQRYQNEPLCQTDEFDDGWIKSISTKEDFTCACTKSCSVEVAGFDDEWIRDVLDMSAAAY